MFTLLLLFWNPLARGAALLSGQLLLPGDIVVTRMCLECVTLIWQSTERLQTTAMDLTLVYCAALMRIVLHLRTSRTLNWSSSFDDENLSKNLGGRASLLMHVHSVGLLFLYEGVVVC